MGYARKCHFLLPEYELDYKDFIISSHYVKSIIISRFDILIVPGEKCIMIAEIHKNQQVFIYQKIEKNDLSRFRRKGNRKRMDTNTRLHE
jgi:hypothetical protein